MRLVSLDRAEAEFIVDACERDGAPQWMELAATLRKQWGYGALPGWLSETRTASMKYLPQWLYLAGSLLFVVGTIVSMVRRAAP